MLRRVPGILEAVPQCSFLYAQSSGVQTPCMLHCFEPRPPFLKAVLPQPPRQPCRPVSLDLVLLIYKPMEVALLVSKLPVLMSWEPQDLSTSPLIVTGIFFGPLHLTHFSTPHPNLVSDIPKHGP